MDSVGALDDDPEEQPTSEDRPEDRALAREAAAAATVLLKNTGVLPLEQTELRRVAVIGPNAGRAVIMGGGSASVPAHDLRPPLDALRDRLGPGVEIDHEPAVDIARTSPEVPKAWLSVDAGPEWPSSSTGPTTSGGEVVHRATNDTGSIVWFGSAPREFVSPSRGGPQTCTSPGNGRSMDDLPRPDRTGSAARRRPRSCSTDSPIRQVRAMTSSGLPGRR